MCRKPAGVSICACLQCPSAPFIQCGHGFQCSHVPASMMSLHMHPPTYVSHSAEPAMCTAHAVAQRTRPVLSTCRFFAVACVQHHVRLCEDALLDAMAMCMRGILHVSSCFRHYTIHIFSTPHSWMRIMVMIACMQRRTTVVVTTTTDWLHATTILGEM